jgi:kanamycin kinase
VSVPNEPVELELPHRRTRGFQEVLLDAYGVDADIDRIAYYRLAWDASEDDRDPPAG